jgi:hypothetical protein
MRSDDQKTAPPTGERGEERARLACQIGRLLAREWLRKRQSERGESLQGEAVPSSPNILPGDL